MTPLSRESCAVILAGGRSRRMGTDKGLLELDGRAMIEHVLEQARAVTDEIWLAAGYNTGYAHLGIPQLSEQFPGQGPLAGLHAAMSRTRRPLTLLLACDIPRIRASILSRLLDAAAGYDAVIPRTSDGTPHPLSAVYRRTCLEAIEASLRQGRNKVLDFLRPSSLKVRWVRGSEGDFEDPDLRNINTPQDFQDLLESGS